MRTCWKRASLLSLMLWFPVALLGQFPQQNRDPEPGRDGNLSAPEPPPGIRGQVVADDPTQLRHPIPIKLESFGIVNDTVFTDGNGNFRFDSIQPGAVYYVVIDAEGFKPFRARVETGAMSPSAVGMNQVFLLESAPPEADPLGDSRPVDLSELTGTIPRDATLAFEQAAEASRAGDYEAAAERLEEAVEIAPGFYEAQNALGVEYQRLGRLDDARRHFEIARELNPIALAPVLSLGLVHLQQSDMQFAADQSESARESLELAFAYLEEGVERDDRSAFAQYYFGIVLHKTGNNDRALDRLTRALELDARLYAARLVLSDVYAARRDFSASVNQLETYLSEYPDSPQRAVIEGVIADRKGQITSP